MDIKVEILAHDINNHLGIISNYLEFSLQHIKENDQTVIPKIKKAIQVTQRCSGLCKSIIQVRKINHSINDLLKNTLSELRETYPECKIDYFSSNATQKEVDPALFKNAIFNILKNSIAADADHLLFFLESDKLKVIDNGKGFPDGLVEGLNSHGMSYLKKQKGIGLMSIYEFCNAHNWVFKIKNSKNAKKGAMIILELY